MITIYFNNEAININSNMSLAQLLIEKNSCGDHYAVAVNKVFIARQMHPSTILKSGDQINIIVPMQGG